MRIRPDQLADQYERADREWPWIHEVNAAHGFPPFLMHALGSRETNLTNVIGDLGRGFGVWQRDIQHGIPDGWMDDVRAQCQWAADYLAGRIAACGTLLGGVNSYNAGSCLTAKTTDGDYGPDVLERRAWLEAHVGGDDTPPAELDPLGTNHDHSVEVPRELAPLLVGTTRSPVADGSGSVEGALAFLESQLGVAEYPPGSNANWLTDWYFGWHVAWCAITVSRALIEAGFGVPDQIAVPGVQTTSAKGWAYCPYLEADFRAAGRWHDADPEPGDLVLYDWDGDGWADHVGMLKEVGGDGTLGVYEGNTDEGVLRLKHRSLTYVRGFARPPYARTPVVAPPTSAQEDDMRIVNVTDRGIFLVKAGVPDHINTPDQVIELALVGFPYEAHKELPAHTFDRFFPTGSDGPNFADAASYAALVAEVRDRLASDG